MILSEVAGAREALPLEGFIAVPRGTLWQKDIHNVWVFQTFADAKAAAHSEQGRKVLDESAGHYLLPVQTLNFVPLLLQVSDAGLRAAGSPDFVVYAYSVSEQSARNAAHRAAPNIDKIWCYKTWNSDPSYFDEELDESIEDAPLLVRLVQQRLEKKQAVYINNHWARITSFRHDLSGNTDDWVARVNDQGDVYGVAFDARTMDDKFELGPDRGRHARPDTWRVYPIKQTRKKNAA